MKTKADHIRSLLCPACTCAVGEHDSAGTCGNHRSCGCHNNQAVAEAYRSIKSGRRASRRR